MSISQAPLAAKDLPLLATHLAEASPAGLFAVYVGRRYDLDALRETDNYSEADEPYLARIRAFSIPALIGRQVVIQQDSELPEAVAHLLAEQFPVWLWDTTDVTLGPFRKYFLVHACLPAPEDVATNQAMALEIYGELLSVDGLLLDTESGSHWRTQQIERYLLASRNGQAAPELTGTLVVEIRAATYANLMYVGVDMPFYM